MFATNDNKTEYIDFSLIDKKHKYGRYSEFLKWDSKGRFDMETFVKRVITDVKKGRDIPDIQLEVILRAQYELNLESFLRNKHKSKNTKKMSNKEFREWYRKKHPFKSTYIFFKFSALRFKRLQCLPHGK